MKNKESSLWQYIMDDKKNVLSTKDYNLIEAFTSSKNKIVRQTYIREYFISTVFLSIDHDFEFEKILIRWNENKPNPNPIVFETMISSEKDGWLSYEVRYRTYKEAVKGHHCAVRMVIDAIRKNKEID